MEVYENPSSSLVLELTSRYIVNRLPAEVRSGKLDLFPAETEKPDGTYRLMIRADEAVVAKDGIPGRILKSHPLDGSRILAECISGSEELELILPAGTPEEFHFTPSSVHLF